MRMVEDPASRIGKDKPRILRTGHTETERLRFEAQGSRLKFKILNNPFFTSNLKLLACLKQEAILQPYA
jgi:hypothetical protein